MPPFRAGLLKRKVDTQEALTNSIQNSADDEQIAHQVSDADENFLRGEMQDADDATDSEQDEAADSDGEVDGVLYDNDADSTLGDDQDASEGSDESTDLTDSEEDDNSEENDEDNESSDEHEASNTQEEGSGDSGTDSGVPQTHSGSSDEADKLTISKQKKKQTSKKKDKLVQKEKHEKSSVDILADKIKETTMHTKPVVQKDEYESGDTSDEEDIVNPRGAVPAWWYREYPHVGYDRDGRRIMRPPQADRIDHFLKQCEDPEFWRTVKDPATGQDIILSKEDLELIARIRDGRTPQAAHDPYEPWVEWFTREVMQTPVRAFPEHKRSFLPSRDEQKHVARIVHALNMGWAKTRKQIAAERRKNKERKLYDLWGAREDEARAGPRHMRAPRRALPSHAESYNPPREYLLDARERRDWDKLAATPWRRKYTFLPTAHASLRSVAAYPRYVRERFLRCLDLYLAPRGVHMRLQVTPEQLLPALPAPRDLQPFPTAAVLTLRGHTAAVRACSIDPAGQYAASAGDDGTVRVWELATGRCLRTVRLPEAAVRVRWTPAAGLSLLAVAAGRRLLLLNPGQDIGAHRVATRTDELLEEPPPQHDTVMDARTLSCVTWDKVTPEEWARGIRLAVTHFKPITHVEWHARGDYVCVTLGEAASRAVVVHQVSRRRSQLPLRRARGLVQAAAFLPARPHLAVATQRAVRIYDLVKQELVRKLLTGAQWIAALAPHPSGDHLLVTTYERKVLWFDLELSSSPYRCLRVHGSAVRAGCFHARYPLFATAGDDNYVVVSHGRVYSDLLQNPLLVPVKQLPAVFPSSPSPSPSSSPSSPLRVLDLVFHPRQPWLLAALADHTLVLYA